MSKDAVDKLNNNVVLLYMTDEPQPGLMNAKRFSDLETLLIDCSRRICELEKLLEAQRNPLTVPPHLLPILNAQPYRPDVK